jgi:hypothetical protein
VYEKYGWIKNSAAASSSSEAARRRMMAAGTAAARGREVLLWIRKRFYREKTQSDRKGGAT